MADSLVQVRFRHYAGDIGPMPFALHTSIEEVKQKVLDAWPADNAELQKVKPTRVDLIRLILSGKYLENVKKLEDYKSEYELKPDTVVTMHLVIREQQQQSKPSGSAAASKPEAKGCGCVIC